MNAIEHGSNHSKLTHLTIGFFLLLIFVCAMIRMAQFHHGLELGMNMTNADFRIDESAEPSNSFGFLIGYVAERDFSDNLYIRFGANYNRREFNAISRRGINTSNEKWGIDVIEVPINLGYYLNWNNRNYQFFVDAGMNLGYNSRAFAKTEDETIRLDIGVIQILAEYPLVPMQVQGS